MSWFNPERERSIKYPKLIIYPLELMYLRLDSISRCWGTWANSSEEVQNTCRYYVDETGWVAASRHFIQAIRGCWVLLFIQETNSNVWSLGEIIGYSQRYMYTLKKFSLHVHPACRLFAHAWACTKTKPDLSRKARFGLVHFKKPSEENGVFGVWRSSEISVNDLPQF